MGKVTGDGIEGSPFEEESQPSRPAQTEQRTLQYSGPISYDSFISTPENNDILPCTQGPSTTFCTAQAAPSPKLKHLQDSELKDADLPDKARGAPKNISTSFVQSDSFEFGSEFGFGPPLANPQTPVSLSHRDIIRNSPKWALAIVQKRISNGKDPLTEQNIFSHNITQYTTAEYLDDQLPNTQNGGVNARLPETQQCNTHRLDVGLPDTQRPGYQTQKSQASDTQCNSDRSSGPASLPVAHTTTTYQPNDQLPDRQLGSFQKQNLLEELAAPLGDHVSGSHKAPSLLQSARGEACRPVTQRDSFLPDTQGPITSVKDSFTTTNSLIVSIKSQRNTLPIRERKRFIIPSTRPAKLTTAFKSWRDKTHALLDPFREDDDCWFHPNPPPAYTINGVARPIGKLQKSFQWQDRIGTHSIVLNFGIVSKLLRGKMTKQQKDGFINRGWHLSHLCGNWTCLNPVHTTVEPGNINISRNNCFSHRSGCLHQPPCMKELKVSLGADGKPVDHELLANTILPPRENSNDWDDWTQPIDDEDESMTIDDEDVNGSEMEEMNS